MDVRSDLIFDVGVCSGDDSAYYLHKGYRVVGVEANPLLIPLLEQRFESEIRDGRYTLVPLGISEDEGESAFWVCDDQPEWSSFDRAIASRNGSRNHQVTVATCRFRSLLEQFGTPLYCKIDIEGNDDLCLADLAEVSAGDRPRFLSVELIDGARQIRLLHRLGYGRFKIVSQRTFRQPGKPLAPFKRRLPAWARRVLTSAGARLTRHGRDGSWRFARGSSGPFGDATPGPWLSVGEALELNRAIAPGEDLWEWFDIHAARAE